MENLTTIITIVGLAITATGFAYSNGNSKSTPDHKFVINKY